ncbi:hypothetical protein [Flavobacterium piscis]|uniref:Lipoprotein n=1 Tax=Flavobacterium piscis TaxID=1114874 RepID=A0ABU1YDH9_9FLAO|nr:hypothetical protein [Flavobacterium piscis]MDR7211675.1 hypothetical protein [Flavobacterium piscis]
MNKIILILSILILVSCKRKPEAYIEKYRNSKLDSLKTIIGKISTKDTSCLKEIDFAQEKIVKDSLTYYVYSSSPSYGRHIEELKKLLKPYGIDCEIFLTSCVGHGKGRSYCYVDFMNETIKNKFKKDFIDSLEAKADRAYLNKNISKIFYSMDEYDETIFYPKAKSIEKQREDVENDFFLTFKYPKDFDFKHKRYVGRSNVEFILYRNGEIKNLKIDTEFEQKSNNKFIPYFDNEIRKFVTKIKWLPRKQRGIKLNAGLGLWFPYNKGNS